MYRGYDHIIAKGALIALSGYILSGPVAFIVVRLVHPQPEWVSPAVFSENYHIVQDIPYYFGFMLVTGMLVVATGHYLNVRKSDEVDGKYRLLLALCCSIVFSGLISFNYICQTTFVRNLAISYRPEYDGVIATFSMANTLSLTWAIEMWGYAFLGMSTALSAGYYRGRNNFLSLLMIANGVVSLAGALITIANVSWVMTFGGLFAYFFWNVLMIMIMVLVYRETATPQKPPLTG